MIKAIVFDCFGVLVGPGFWNVYKAAGGDPEKDHDYLQEQLDLTSVAAITGAQFRSRIATKLGLTQEQYDAVIRQQEVPHQDLFDYIRTELRPHYKLAVLSNANTGTLQRKIPPELLNVFDVLVVSGEERVMKPDPEIYQTTCQRLGLQPNEVIFTDDQRRYITPANQLGMHGVLYKGVDDLRRHIQQIVEQHNG